MINLWERFAELKCVSDGLGLTILLNGFMCKVDGCVVLFISVYMHVFYLYISHVDSFPGFILCILTTVWLAIPMCQKLKKRLWQYWWNIFVSCWISCLHTFTCIIIRSYVNKGRQLITLIVHLSICISIFDPLIREGMEL